MKKYWKDYINLCKESGNFCKKHWFGVIVMNIVSIAGMMLWFNKDEVKDRFKEKFSKDKKEVEL